MLDKKIQEKLYKVSPVEQEQFDNHGKNVHEVTLSEDTDEKDEPIKLMPYWDFFDHGRIAVTRSNRFSYVPAHRHKFIEMNYCYSGRSIQYIDDEFVTLQPGQLLIMDRQIQHRLNYARRQDILLNILLRDDYEVNELIDGYDEEHNLLLAFLKNVMKRKFNHHNYLIIDLNSSIPAKQLIENIISLAYDNPHKNNLLLKRLMQSLFLCCNNDMIIHKKINFNEISKDKSLQIVEYINNHYQDLTLDKLATQFGYNTNYLGNLIVQSTGHTFKELLQMRRLNIACNLLQTRNMSIEGVSYYVGYENHSSLFRLFKKYLGITPKEYRRRIRYPQALDNNSEENIIPNPYYK